MPRLDNLVAAPLACLVTAWYVTCRGWAARFACLKSDNVVIYGPSYFEVNREYPRFPCRHVTVDFNLRRKG